MNSSNSSLNDDSNFKIYVYGPNNVLVSVTDEVLANFKDESLFALEVNPSGAVLMKSVVKKNSDWTWFIIFRLFSMRESFHKLEVDPPQLHKIIFLTNISS